MNIQSDKIDVFIPDGTKLDAAIKRITHLGVGAHQDDLEIMAVHGILECFGQTDKWFAGITCTDGAGSPRTGIYANHTDLMMQEVRKVEQRTAASVGQYGIMVQLGYSSKDVKFPQDQRVVSDLAEMIRAMHPQVVYTHNPADKHDTHVAVMLRTIEAIRMLPPNERPRQLVGCEVWRDLDWVPDSTKIVFDVSGHEGITSALLGVYDSQVAGGKRYDLASLGRRRANATYFESHGVDTTTAAVYAIDLTPLIVAEQIKPELIFERMLKGFSDDVHQRLSKLQ